MAVCFMILYFTNLRELGKMKKIKVLCLKITCFLFASSYRAQKMLNDCQGMALLSHDDGLKQIIHALVS